MQDKPVFQVNMFARFAMMGGGKEITEDDINSSSLVSLIAFLIYHRDRVCSTDELIQLLWPEGDVDGPAGALKNLVYRARGMLRKIWPEEDFIVSGRGYYGWSDDVEIRLDTDEFTACLAHAEASESRKVRTENYMKAVSIYKGDFLPYLSGEYKATSAAAHYHYRFLNAAWNTAALLLEAGRYAEMSEICAHALSIDGYDETLHSQYLRSLIRQNKRDAAVSHYKKAKSILYENLGISHPEELEKAFEEMTSTDAEHRPDIDGIQRELAGAMHSGAFLCSYDVFHHIYSLEKRRMDRMGLSNYLMLMSLPLEISDNEKELNRTERVLLDSLRSGDVVARCGPGQFVILLEACQYESAVFVSERITKRWRRSAPVHQLPEFGFDEVLPEEITGGGVWKPSSTTL